MNETVVAQQAPAALGPYCHGKLAGNTLYTSGQLGLDPVSNTLVTGAEGQAAQALTNLGQVLSAAGMTYTDVVKTTVFLKNISDFTAINSVYAQFFTQSPPARSCVEVAALPMGALFEIECIAVK